MLFTRSFCFGGGPNCVGKGGGIYIIHWVFSLLVGVESKSTVAFYDNGIFTKDPLGNSIVIVIVIVMFNVVSASPPPPLGFYVQVYIVCFCLLYRAAVTAK